MLGNATLYNKSLIFIFSISEKNNNWIDVVSLIAYVVLTIIIISITYWLAYKSPQAIRAKIEMNMIAKDLRAEHFSQIDSQILSNLKTGTINRTTSNSDLKISFKDLSNNAYFEVALNHIEYGCKDIEMKYKELLNELYKYNKNVDAFNDHLKSKVHDYSYDDEYEIFESTEYIKIDSKQLFLSGLRQIIIDICSLKSTIQNETELEESIRKFLRDNKKIEIVPPIPPYEVSSTKIWFVGFLLSSYIGKNTKPFSDESVEKLVNLIVEITLQSDVIGEYKNLKSYKNRLEQFDYQYKTCFESISNAIQAKIYDIRLNNCCDDKTLLK